MGVDVEGYARRIASATPGQLVVINFEIIMDYLKNAEAHAGGGAAFKKELSGARDFLRELAASLDMGADVSAGLMRIYMYVNKLIIEAETKADAAPLAEAAKLLAELRGAFAQAAAAETGKPPVMGGVPKTFAGLTYNSKGELSEFSDKGGSEYKA